MISEIFHPDEAAIARLAEEFGPSPAKYVDFQADSGATDLKSVSFFLMALLVAFLLWRNLYNNTNTHTVQKTVEQLLSFLENTFRIVCMNEQQLRAR